jgi:hypothetical protein
LDSFVWVTAVRLINASDLMACHDSTFLAERPVGLLRLRWTPGAITAIFPNASREGGLRFPDIPASTLAGTSRVPTPEFALRRWCFKSA